MLNNKIPPVIVVLVFPGIMALIAHYSVIDFSLRMLCVSGLFSKAAAQPASPW